MDVTASRGEFFVGMFQQSGAEYAWDKKNRALIVSGKRQYPTRVTTYQGDFIEAVDQKTGDLLAEGGDGDWFYIPEGKKPVILRFKKLPAPKLTRAKIDKARKETTVHVAAQQRHDSGPFNFGASYEDGTLQNVIDSLLAMKAGIPKAHRAKARCEIDSEGGYEGSHYASIKVSYVRPETDEEVIARVQIESERSRLAMLRDKAELSRLSQKLAVA
jgi:hypothetical protein